MHRLSLKYVIQAITGVFMLLAPSMMVSQNPPGDSCIDSQPLCYDPSGALVFRNTTGVAGSGRIGCLSTTPNPAWYLLRVDQPGDLQFTIEQWQDTNGNNIPDPGEPLLDVDFIAWGPFPDDTSTDNCSRLANECDPNGDGVPDNQSCPDNTVNPLFYQQDQDNTNIVDCSWSPLTSESFSIINAGIAEYYYLMITNFSGQPGLIRLRQNNLGNPGAGSTDCSIVAGNLGRDQDVCFGTRVTLDGTTAGAISYTWSVDTTPDDGIDNFMPLSGEMNPTLEITNNVSGIYRSTVNDGMSSASDEVLILFRDVPTANTPLIWQACDDDNDGVSSFNLQTKDAEVLNGQDPSIFRVTYHPTAGDAMNNVNALPTNYQNTGRVETIHVRITNANNAECFDTTSFDIEVYDSPTAVDISIPLVNCSMSPMAEFNLSAIAGDVSNFQMGVNVVFYPTLADANAETNAITTPAAYMTATGSVFARVSDPAQNNCSNIAEVSLEVIPTPERRDTTPMVFCSDTNQSEFDLLSQEAFIINGQSNVTVTFHESNADAQTGANPILTPATYTSITRTVYARSEANYNGSICFNVSEVSLVVNPNPPANDILISACSDSDVGSFEVASRVGDITNNDASLTVQFFETLAGAENNIGTEEIRFPFNTISRTVFVRVFNPTTTCVSFSELELEVIGIPVVDESLSLTECFKNEQVTFNLADERSRLDGIYPLYDFEFYATEQEAIDQGPQLPDAYSAAEGNIYVRVILVGTDCYITKPIALQITPTPKFSEDSIFCAEEGFTLPNGQVVFEGGTYVTIVQEGTDGCDVEYTDNIAPGNILFPTAFSPNGNSMNDRFGPEPNIECGIQVENFELFVWNRWGQQVFATNTYGEEWDGRFSGQQAPAGAYVWYVSYTYQGQGVKQKGIINLIR